VNRRYSTTVSLDGYSEEAGQERPAPFNPLCTIQAALVIALILFWVPGLFVYLFAGFWKLLVYGAMFLGTLSVLGCCCGRRRRSRSSRIS
jgi:hypothetical protein